MPIKFERCDPYISTARLEKETRNGSCIFRREHKVTFHQHNRTQCVKTSSLLTGTYQPEFVLIHGRRQNKDIGDLAVGGWFVGLAIRGHCRLVEGGSWKARAKEKRLKFFIYWVVEGPGRIPRSGADCRELLFGQCADHTREQRCLNPRVHPMNVMNVTWVLGAANQREPTQWVTIPEPPRARGRREYIFVREEHHLPAS